MACFTNYFANALINHGLRNVPYTPPATVYVALFTAAPDATGAGTEVSVGGYVRKPIAFAAPATRTTNNGATIDWDPASADWGAITHATVFDALTGGNMLLFKTLAATKTVHSGETFSIGAGDATFHLD
jgi:hypothetical protein